MKKGISYYRVSTQRQGASGLGLEAQKAAVQSFAALYDYEIVDEFIEIESGKKAKRPILIKTLEQCSKINATLLIAKLDRLGRNVAFISRLMESGSDFVAVDNPTANKFMVHIMAAFAEYEREQISKRTIEALSAAKKRGIELGKYGKNVLSKNNKKTAISYAIKMEPVINQLRKEGYTSIRKLTDQLNKIKVKTFTGGKTRWHVSSVYKLVKRIHLQKNAL